MTCAVSWCHQPGNTSHEEWMMCPRHAILMIHKERGDFTPPPDHASPREHARWRTRYDQILTGLSGGPR